MSATTQLTMCIVVLGLPIWPCDRARQTMGRNIESAETVAIVNVIASASAGIATVTVGEYLKDNSGPSRTAFTLPMWGCPSVPAGKGIAILLSKGWQSNQWPVLEVYRDPAELAELRVLVKLYALGSEKARLEGLRAHLTDDGPGVPATSSSMTYGT